MKIWFVEIGEPLPLEEKARLHFVGTTSRKLVELGHEVTWWTSSFSHAKKAHLVDKDSDMTVNGVRLKILSGGGYAKNISFARIRHQKFFAEKCAKLMANESPPDIVVGCVPTIDGAATVVNYGLKNKVPTVISIRDLWPDEIVDLAPNPLRPFARLALNSAFRKMRKVTKGATGLVGISDSYLEYGLKSANRAKSSVDEVITLGYSGTVVSQESLEQATSWWRKFGVRSDKFVCCFFGTIGRYFDLSTVIEAARRLDGKSEFQFILCGEGSRRAEFEKQAAGLTNVFFSGWVDEPKIQALMRLSQAGLAPYKLGAKMALPNKPFEYLSGGLCIVSSLKGDLEQYLTHYNCGLSYKADSVDELVKHLSFLAASSDRVVEMKKRSRGLFDTHFSADIVAKKWSDYLTRMARQNR